MRVSTRILLELLCVALAAAIWLPALPLLHRPSAETARGADGELGPLAERLLTRQLALWNDPERRAGEVARMRAGNAEWDFMGRTFLVLALANAALREPERRDEALAVIDLIVAETVRLEREEGFRHFLLPYGHGTAGWVSDPARSIFVDGEITLMMAARRLVAERDDWREPMDARVAIMIEQMRASPVVSAESYPDECWLFCNSVALAAVALTDALEGTDRATPLARDWIAAAKKTLIHEETGLLIATYQVDGSPHPAGPGPEGTSIFIGAHMLQTVDQELAADQYRRAAAELTGTLLGFGYAREWPVSAEGSMDIDSGPIVPIVDASAASSGLAMVGAAAFEDEATLLALLASLEALGFPEDEADGSRRYLAGNQVGDAVLLYALTLGPLWDEAARRRQEPRDGERSR